MTSMAGVVNLVRIYRPQSLVGAINRAWLDTAGPMKLFAFVNTSPRARVETLSQTLPQQG